MTKSILDSWYLPGDTAPPAAPAPVARAAAKPKPKPAAKLDHMMKYRSGSLVGTRCGLELKLDSSRSQMDQNIVSSERRVTCPECTLKPKEKI